MCFAVNRSAKRVLDKTSTTMMMTMVKATQQWPQKKRSAPCSSVCSCVRVTSFIICFSMQWQWQWQWQYHRYCERFGVFIFIPLDWIHWLRVRKPKNFVKSSHSSIIIRALSVTCTFCIHVCLSLSVGVRVYACVSTHSISIKSHETQIFLQDVYSTCTVYSARNTYAVLPFIGSTPTSIGMTEIAFIFSRKIT